MKTVTERWKIMSYDMLNYVISDLFLRKNDGDYVAGIKYKYSWEKIFIFQMKLFHIIIH